MEIYSDTGTISASSVADLKERSYSGIGDLIRRQIVLKTLSFLANIMLARLLAPQAFGLFAIVLFVVQFFSTFGDVGIGAALIQKKGEITREELSSTFWLQQMLVWAVICTAFLAAPLALRFYPSMPAYGVWLIRAMCVSFALTSLKTVPVILMERRMDFRRIALVDVVEITVFYATAILLALAGFEVWSFIVAALLRSLAGVLLIYALSEWLPSFIFNRVAVRDLVRFGLPYQGSSILSFLKDSVTPLFIGIYCGASAVGFVNWARGFALAPLMLSESFGRVAFPAFSRIQGDKDLLIRAIERSIRSITLIMFPVTALMIALGPELIRVLFTEKWLPGLSAYYFYCTSPLIIGIVLPMYSAILALGRSGVILKMGVALLVLEWGLGVPLVIYFGFNGIAFSQPIIAVLFSMFYYRVLAGRGVKIKVFTNTRVSFVSALAAGLLSKTVMAAFTVSVWTVAAAGAAGFLAYLCGVYLLERSALSEFRENLSRIYGASEKS